MAKLFRIEHNVETGEVKEVELTNDEIAELQAEEAAKQAQIEAAEEAEAAKQAAKVSAESKLAALGLTAEEIAAFRG